MKDLEKDRFILDARPANQLEAGLTTWTATMGSVVPLLSLCIPPDYVVACSGEDLRDYYYYFCISPSRTRRNAIHFELSLEEAKQFRAYSNVVPGQRRYIPALDTMAMGFFFLLYAAWVRSRAERPSVSYTKVVMEVAWTGHNLQFTKTN